MQMNMSPNAGWQFMQDGVIFAEVNHQGGPRGGTELVVPNWWMGMASRDTSRGRVDVHGHAQPRSGHRRQGRLPRDLSGRRSAARASADRPPASARSVHAAGGGMARADRSRPPASRSRAGQSANRRSDPSRSCIAHRRQTTRRRRSATIPSIRRTSRSASSPRPLITGRWVVEGSLFNGREPDENRWDFDFGPTRLVLRPRLVPARPRSGSCKRPAAAS